MTKRVILTNGVTTLPEAELVEASGKNWISVMFDGEVKPPRTLPTHEGAMVLVNGRVILRRDDLYWYDIKGTRWSEAEILATEWVELVPKEDD